MNLGGKRGLPPGVTPGPGPAGTGDGRAGCNAVDPASHLEFRELREFRGGFPGVIGAGQEPCEHLILAGEGAVQPPWPLGPRSHTGGGWPRDTGPIRASRPLALTWHGHPL